ncbi:preprotein translocase subunit SecD [Parelusimicrobium proximum]|uniref:protein translocase subunit SecD n=1 Tax=Parelusimicrobium proximum TaxID=3228953 RepID=UPI003D1760AB
MQGKLAVKWAVILAVVFGAIYLLVPSYEWYSKTEAERNRAESTGERPKRILNLGLDLRGGSSLLLELDTSELPAGEGVNDAMARAIGILRNRIDQYGVGETTVTRQGEKWISVQLPGIANPAAAEALIGKTAMLEFRIVKQRVTGLDKFEKAFEETEQPFDPETNLIKPELAKLLPSGVTAMKTKDGGFYEIVEDTAKVTGADLETAQVNPVGGNGFPEVSFSFNAEGAKKFGQLTGSNKGRPLAIILDNIIQSAPNIEAKITKQGVITGRFSLDEAKNLAIVLRAGALPAPVKIIEKSTLGPGLGEDSIKAGVKASLIALAVIIIFMVVYYRLGGVMASIALCLNLVLLMGLMAYFSATLTLPGIAGIILSLAMAIDANVLILERMREEKKAGEPVAEIISRGYGKAWSAILDSNVTTWIAAAFLFQFGSGPVKGFAVTLTLGLVVGVFTAVYVTRAMYETILTSNPKDISL